jgi:hypothetical protein
VFVKELDRLVVTVSQHTVFLAEAAIYRCGSCSNSPGVPFAQVLELVGGHPAGTVDFILPVLGYCPSCQSELDEQSTVIPKASRAR